MVEPYASGIRFEVDACPKRPHQTTRLLQSACGPFPFLFVGLSDGTLRSYMKNEQTDFIRWQTDHNRLYHPCCTILDTWGVFITIVKNRITVFDLPLQQLDAGVAHDDSKGAVLFAVHEEAKTLCVLLQSNTLKVFDWTIKRDFSLRTQHQVQLSVQQLVVLSERHVFIQGKNKWIILHLDSGKVVHLADNVKDKIHDVLESESTSCDVIAVPSCYLSRRRQHVMDALLCGKHQGVIISIVEGTKKNPCMEKADLSFVTFNAPLEISQDDSEDSPLDMTTSDSRIQIERILAYDATPHRAFYHHPFLVLDQVEQLAVYNFGTFRIVQTLPVQGTFDLCAIRKGKTSIGGESSEKSLPSRDTPSTFLVTVSPPFTVQAFQMFSIGQLVATCMGNQLLQDAVGLCKLCPEESPLSDADQRKLYADYGFKLFHSGRRQEAMKFFYKSEIDVTEVLLLFPRNLLPRKVSALWKDTIRSQNDHIIETDDLVESLIALMGYLQRKRNDLLREQADETARMATRRRPRPENALELIDTMLVKCLVVVSEEEKYQEQAKRALLEVVTGPNWCEISEAEVFLRAHRRFKALLAFYSARKLHRKALELLEDLEQRSAAASLSETTQSAGELLSSFEYLVLIAQYLRALDTKHTELVFEFSRRVLSVNPALGLSIFTQRDVPSSKLDIDPVAVLQHLKSCSIATASAPEIVDSEGFARASLPLTNSHMLAIEYLTQLIYEGMRPLTPRLHDEVVFLLLEAIQATRSSNERLTSRVDVQNGAIGILRRKLLEFLEFPRALYHPERMLSRTPVEMLDEHAALLSKLGRHREVLQLYALELNDAALAEAYCNRCYESKAADKSIYSTLLKIYLRPEDHTSRAGLSRASCVDSSPSDAKALDAAINLLNKYAERIEVASALELLPGDVTVASLTEFLRRVLEHQVQRCRNGQVKTQLSKMANFTTREQLSTKRKQAVTIWMSQRCHSCGKKLGSGTFVRLANGNLLHYSCQPIP